MKAIDLLRDWKMPSNQWRSRLKMSPTKANLPRSAFELLATTGPPAVKEICELDPSSFGWIMKDSDLCNRIKIEALYENAIKNQKIEVNEIKRDEALLIPKNIDYLSKSLCLSNEERDKLMKIQPQSIAAAARIPHITPSTIMRLLRYVKQNYNVN